MKVLLLSDINSAHTQKWAIGLSKKGIDIGIFSISKPVTDWYAKYNIVLLSDSSIENQNSSSLSKLGYFKFIPKLKAAIKKFKPDIVHGHYASSYGILGARSGFHPFVLSVWGSDVYDFPNKSIPNKLILKYNLKKADQIVSTSHIMAKETKKYTSKNIVITPFGVDLNIFKPTKVKSVFSSEDIVIGTVKSLEIKYGIDYLLKAFAILKMRCSELPLKLLIVGDGSEMDNLKALSKSLKIENETIFTGKVVQEDVPKFQNMLTVYVSLSIYNSESFGVAAIEASACEKPVVVSDVDGFKEVVDNNVTGIIVPKCNIEETVKAIEFFILDKGRSLEFGKNGRVRVSKLYNWEDNLQLMIRIYKELLTIENDTFNPK